MKKMLITGASGFLGSRAAKYFADSYELYLPTHAQMDITHRQSVETVFQAFRPDTVIHCAAMADVEQCRQEPETSWKRNVDGSVNVARAARMVGAKCLLCSSDQVYFSVADNLYAKEKRTAEVQGLDENPDSVFLRLSWMYEPNPDEARPHRDFFSNLLPKLHTEESLFFSSRDRRGITDVNEVVANMEKALMLPGGVYDFGAPNDKDMLATAVCLFRELGLDINRIRENEAAFKDGPRDMTMKQDQLNAQGIFFKDTTQALIENFRKYI